MEWIRAAWSSGSSPSGTALLLIAAIGTLRLPDIFLRMSATSKASSLGASCLLLALAVGLRRHRDQRPRAGRHDRSCC
jgi:multisubunit Na+/H+ antiporter MnhG subunit